VQESRRAAGQEGCVLGKRGRQEGRCVHGCEARRAGCTNWQSKGQAMMTSERLLPSFSNQKLKLSPTRPPVSSTPSWLKVALGPPWLLMPSTLYV